MRQESPHAIEGEGDLAFTPEMLLSTDPPVGLQDDEEVPSLNSFLSLLSYTLENKNNKEKTAVDVRNSNNRETLTNINESEETDIFLGFVPHVLENYRHYKAYIWIVDVGNPRSFSSAIHPQLSNIEKKMLALRDLFQYGNNVKNELLQVRAYNKSKVPTDQITWHAFRGQCIPLRFQLINGDINEVKASISDLYLIVNFIYVLKSCNQSYIESFYQGNTRLQNLINCVDEQSFKKIISFFMKTHNSLSPIKVEFFDQINKKAALDYILKESIDIPQYKYISALLKQFPIDHDDHRQTNISLDYKKTLNNAADDHANEEVLTEYILCNRIDQLGRTQLSASPEPTVQKGKVYSRTEKRKRTDKDKPTPKRSYNTIDKNPALMGKLQTVINSSPVLQGIVFGHQSVSTHPGFFAGPITSNNNNNNNTEITNRELALNIQTEAKTASTQQATAHPTPLAPATPMLALDAFEEPTPYAMDKFFQTISQHPDFLGSYSSPTKNNPG